MNRDDILRMADEAYELAKKDLLNGDYLTTGFLAIRDIHFHRLATAAEREACLALVNQGTGEATSADALKILRMERDRISAAIRARGEQEQPR
jgi:histidine ammonia-lyase